MKSNHEAKSAGSKRKLQDNYYSKSVEKRNRREHSSRGEQRGENKYRLDKRKRVSSVFSEHKKRKVESSSSTTVEYFTEQNERQDYKEDVTLYSDEVTQRTERCSEMSPTSPIWSSLEVIDSTDAEISDIEDGEIVDDCDGESEIEADELVAAFDEDDDSEDEELGTKPRVLKSLKKLFSDE